MRGTANPDGQLQGAEERAELSHLLLALLAERGGDGTSIAIECHNVGEYARSGRPRGFTSWSNEEKLKMNFGNKKRKYAASPLSLLQTPPVLHSLQVHDLPRPLARLNHEEN